MPSLELEDTCIFEFETGDSWGGTRTRFLPFPLTGATPNWGPVIRGRNVSSGPPNTLPWETPTREPTRGGEGGRLTV